MSGLTLKSTQFRRERERAWDELEALVARCDSDGIRSLSAAEVLSLSTLYQHAVGSLSTARAISLDRNLLEYLESLVARAHLCVYGFRQRPWDAAREFLVDVFPSAVRRRKAHAAVALVILLGTMAAGSAMVARDEERYYAVVSSERAGGRTPAATTEALRKTLYDEEQNTSLELESFATLLFTHNAGIGLLCAALGVAAGLPIPPLLAMTGLELGAMAELFRSRGLALEFWAWVLPHGVTELLAVVLCAAAGLSAGFAFVFPGDRTRRDAVAAVGQDAGTIVLGALGMFLIAATVEGIFRQTVLSVPVRWAVAVGFAALWACYFTLVGRGHERELR